MNLDTFSTIQTTQPGGPAKSAAHAPESGQTGAQDFLNLLVTRLNENEAAQKKAAAETAAASAKEKTQALDIVKILSDSAENSEQAAKDGENFSLDLLTQIANVMNMNQQAIKAQLDSNPELIKGLTADQQPGSIQAMLKTLLLQDGNAAASLKQALEKLQQLASEGSPLVITANLTPDQITALQKLVAPADINVTADTATAELAADASTDAKKDEAMAALMFGLVSLLPPEQRPQLIVVPRTIVTADNKVNADAAATSKPANDMAATLNNLISPGDTYGEPLPEEGEAGFKNLLERMTGEKTKAGANTDAVGKVKVPTATPDLSALQNWQFGTQDTALGSWGTDSSVDGIYNVSSGTHGGSLSSLTNPVMQAQSAGQSVPPSQMVALSLQKQAAGNENKRFTLQLDPPELGRVEVRMEFAKDKSVKAHMIIEKPETLAMLQRDGHNLERSLLIDSIDTGGNASISFELASQDHDFQNDGGHDGGNRSGGGGKNIDSEKIIETTMSWHVDPNTGHTRYRLLV